MRQPTAARILAASLVGTAVEFYDFYIYATAAALVFGPLFFPAENADLQLLLSFASFAVAFVARPIGALVFGHYGDRLGRKSTLVASLLLMGLSTFAIAFLPTHAAIGVAAPIILCALRFGQGFGLGGEWGGAALLAVENAPPGWRARYGMFPQLGAPVGFIAANGLFLILGLWLDDGDFLNWGWRLPFAGSIALVAVGLWVRLTILETPAFAAMVAHETPPAVPLAELVRDHWRETLCGIAAAVTCFAIFYIATAFALGHGTTVLGYTREAFLQLQLGAILFLAAGIIAAGWAADKSTPARVLMLGSLATVLVGAGMGPLMQAGPGGVFAFLALALFVMGFVYGPLGAFLPGLFPARVRYTGASVAFNMGGIIGGGLTPVIGQALAGQFGIGAVGWYLAGAALVSATGLALLPKAEAATSVTP
ncbi:MFS transporter [Sandarakinorhabdus rubra]|uniref:MFS transporter n=1 Tax=Sandarakinorhabdus rubra TaxID=2672568 RepID=UPI0013DAF899|nr:MFS transporter [Sandarakinorhabdus rubra]